MPCVALRCEARAALLPLVAGMLEGEKGRGEPPARPRRRGGARRRGMRRTRRTRRPRGQRKQKAESKVAKSKEIPIGLPLPQTTEAHNRAQSTDHPPLDSTTDQVPGKGNALQYANARCQTTSTYHFNKHASVPLRPCHHQRHQCHLSWDPHGSCVRSHLTPDVPPDRPSRQGLSSSVIIGNNEVGRLALLYRYFS